MKNRKMQEKGITLIALVVTIIVLLILAGISISMLTGQNGILNRASQAKKAQSTSQVEELAKLKLQELYTDNLGVPDDTTVKTAIAEELRKQGYEVQNVTTSNATVKGILIKDTDGNIKEEEYEVYPDDVMKQQWTVYGDNQISNIKENPVVTEYNPDLRVTEDKEGIQFALNMLSFKAGLGTKYYEFNGTAVVTATQYVGDRQDLVSNANKHRKRVDEFVSGIGKAILLLGRVLFKEGVTEDCLVTITDKDGFMVDTETAKNEFRKDIAQGIRKPWEYRVKFLGEDEKTAKARIADDNIDDIKTE